MTIELAVEKSVNVRAPVATVWGTITDLERIPRWLNGVKVETTWKVGEPISFTGDWQGKPLEERATILHFEPEKALQYGQWRGRATSPKNQSVVTFTVAPHGNETVVFVRHDHLATDVDRKHADFHWGVTLVVLRDVIEGRK